MVRIGRDIFFDLAWLHEAFLDHPSEAIKLGHLHDRFNEYTTYVAGLPTFVPGFPTRSHGAARRKITTGLVAEGNRDLLENEQKSIIPPHYEELRTFVFSGLPTPFTNTIHPYHRAFIREVPTGDILNTEDRWRWITFPDGMYQRWDDIGADERTRLTSLLMDDLVAGRFGPAGRPELLPAGGPWPRVFAEEAPVGRDRPVRPATEWILWTLSVSTGSRSRRRSSTRSSPRPGRRATGTGKPRRQVTGAPVTP